MAALSGMRNFQSWSPGHSENENRDSLAATAYRALGRFGYRLEQVWLSPVTGGREHPE
jgi:hypothetical protein